jgi:hypothetical protein
MVVGVGGERIIEVSELQFEFALSMKHLLLPREAL